MTQSAVYFDELQAEQVAWSVKNFGVQPPHRPMLGIIEELCELEEADNEENREEIVDAIGDISIYMLDYCGKRQWRMQEVWDARTCPDWLEEYDITEYGVPYVSGFIKRLSHAQLKGEQNIRGGSEKHDQDIKATLSGILWMLDGLATFFESDYSTILNEVWAKVSKRDWVANPNTAHTEAEGMGG